MLEKRALFDNFFSKNRIRFTVISAGVFISLFVLFYIIYGNMFVHETYLYHLIRKDNRHNFSVTFYYIYLNFENITPFKAALTFLP